MSVDPLFTPYQLGTYKLRNRLGVAPMTRMSSPGDGIPRQDVLDFLVRRARNGAAVVYTEAIVTDYESAQGYPRQARLLTQRQVDAWRRVTDEIRDAGAVSIMQMFHCGRMAWPEINPAGRAIAPSPVTPRQENPLTGKPYPTPDGMSLFDIEHVINGFVETARGALAAGFDGVEVHGAHGYLVSQFLSAYSNLREDDYGGTVENRYRFAHQVIRAVRDVVPGDRLLTFRISDWGVADTDVSLFGTREEWQRVIRLLDDDSLDAISVSCVDAAQTAFGSDRTLAALTREVTAKPLMICGRIHDRASAETALAHADIALSAKSMLLNPDWVEDVRADRPLGAFASEDANLAYTEEPLP
ncbi:MAG: NADH-dependent flavin oxidoreductase [Gammaproteobacteria bacterium]|jgi:2,4-dienoyl-CoA reductase-like NADH-dependent reductase (Old Yellow Enzyme family)